MAALALVIAVLSFVLVERPIRRMQLIVHRPALGLAGGGVLVAISIAVVALSSPLASLGTGPAVAAPALAAGHRLTLSQLAADLRRGVMTKKVPSNLTPSLTAAAGAVPLIVSNGCSLQDAGVKSKPCIFGDTRSHTSVVLFGDSHATTWFPALDMISKQQHWRLVDLTKAACPPAEVTVRRKGAPYANCTAWRRNTEQKIAALHPALVVMASSRYDAVSPLAGVPTGFGSTWQNGVAAIFNFLHRSATRVVFISDVPRLSQPVPDCVSGHLSNVRPCTIARSAATNLPKVKAEELKLAKREQITAIDPMSWFCTPTRCPVIVGNILLYRDAQHMVPAWSRFIAPVLSDSIVPIMQTKAAG